MTYQVGVAISASLLPPAVNAGFFWALSLLVAATGGNVGMYGPKVISIFTNLALSSTDFIQKEFNSKQKTKKYI